MPSGPNPPVATRSCERARHAPPVREVVTLYELLGVEPDADAEEIRRAWLACAKRFHPDAHPQAPPEVRERLSQKMAEVNRAYEVLSDPLARAAYDRSLARPAAGSEAGWGAGAPPSPYRDPGPDECWVCGSAPAVDVRFRQESGRLVWRVRRWIDGPFCRTCGTAVFRAMTNRTLVTGWWGLISFFQNLASVVANLAAYSRIRRLEAPRPNPGWVLSLTDRPLDPGRPLWRRSGVWFAAALLVALVSWGASDQSGPTASRPRLEPGACVAFVGTSARAVPCDEPHDAVVLDIVERAGDCPLDADYAGVRGDGRVVCLGALGSP